MKYWHKCISEAFSEHGITATEEQIALVAEWVEGAHENYGMAFGHDAIPNPLKLENDDLKKKLATEKEKVFCRECNGSGRIIDNFGPSGRSSNSQCRKCNGIGKT